MVEIMKKQQSILDFLPELIFGAEGDENSKGPSSDSNGESSNSSTDSEETAGSSSDDQQDDNSSHDDADDPKVKGLKTALAEERKAAKEAAKRANALQKEKDARELAEKTAIEQAEIREQKANERVQRLADGLLKTRLEAAITAAAADFIDPADAIDGVDRSALTYEQDDDDPSQITIDVKSVQKAVKDLATRKPHYLKHGTDDGEPSGSSFGGSRRKKQTDDETYKDTYPSLR